MGAEACVPGGETVVKEFALCMLQEHGNTWYMGLCTEHWVRAQHKCHQHYQRLPVVHSHVCEAGKEE